MKKRHAGKGRFTNGFVGDGMTVSREVACVALQEPESNLEIHDMLRSEHRTKRDADTGYEKKASPRPSKQTQ